MTQNVLRLTKAGVGACMLFAATAALADPKQDLLVFMGEVEKLRAANTSGWSVSFSDLTETLPAGYVDVAEFGASCEGKRVRYDLTQFAYDKTTRKPQMLSLQRTMRDDSGRRLRGTFHKAEMVPQGLEDLAGTTSQLRLGLVDDATLITVEDGYQDEDKGFLSLRPPEVGFHLLYSACLDNIRVSPLELQESFEVTELAAAPESPGVRRFLCTTKRPNGEQIRLQLDFDTAKGGMPVRSEVYVSNGAERVEDLVESTTVRWYEGVEFKNGHWAGLKYYSKRTGKDGYELNLAREFKEVRMNSDVPDDVFDMEKHLSSQGFKYMRMPNGELVMLGGDLGHQAAWQLTEDLEASAQTAAPGPSAPAAAPAQPESLPAPVESGAAKVSLPTTVIVISALGVFALALVTALIVIQRRHA